MGKSKDQMQKVASLANASDKLRQRMYGWESVIQFEFEDEQIFHIAIHDRKMVVKDGPYIAPNVVVKGKSSDFARVVTGDISISHPIALGKMKVAKGDYLELMRLERIIMGTTKRR